METKQAWGDGDAALSISRAARFLGIHESTLRSYEERGLIRVAFRTPGGHRRYLVDDLRQLRAVGQAPAVVPPWSSKDEAAAS